MTRLELILKNLVLANVHSLLGPFLVLAPALYVFHTYIRRVQAFAEGQTRKGACSLLCRRRKKISIALTD